MQFFILAFFDESIVIGELKHTTVTGHIGPKIKDTKLLLQSRLRTPFLQGRSNEPQPVSRWVAITKDWGVAACGRTMAQCGLC